MSEDKGQPRRAPKHQFDIRNKEVINLTNQLVRTISQANASRITQSPLLKKPNQPQKKTLPRQHFLYVCFQGLPPFDNQFQSLNLPGEKLIIQPMGFQFNITEEQRKQNAKNAHFQNQAKNVNARINAKSLTKPLILVYHSYGTYIASAYLHIYKPSRIIGMIDIGGAPITMNPVIQIKLAEYQANTLEYFQSNIDSLARQFNQLNKAMNMKQYTSKYMLYSFIVALKTGNLVYQIFQLNRHWPKVLKCIAFGRKDQFFTENLLNEKAVYYGYTQKLQKQYEQSMLKKYKEVYETTISNIQERFIFNIENGYHSLHMQKKLQQTLINIVNEYLFFIEECEVAAKL